MTGEQGYANPAAIVSTQWVADHLNDPKVRLIEVDVDTAAYGQGHIQGAVGVNWTTQLGDPIRRDIPSKGSVVEAARRCRRLRRHAHHLLRRQQQLVRRLRLLGQQDLRTPGRRADERRAQEVGARESAIHHRRAEAADDQLLGQGARLEVPRLTQGRAWPIVGHGAGRRALAGRVQRRSHRASRHERDCSARGPRARRRRTSPGRRQPTKMARSSRPKSSRRSMATRASPPTKTSSRIAASASARRFRGSS